ncbi:MAG: hypothetical protein MZV63_32050 [Marinilabiliales bacterium]|nr:hypothetical protein [Marinilabiliales bacterium]
MIGSSTKYPGMNEYTCARFLETCLEYQPFEILLAGHASPGNTSGLKNTLHKISMSVLNKRYPSNSLMQDTDMLIAIRVIVTHKKPGYPG